MGSKSLYDSGLVINSDIVDTLKSVGTFSSNS